jgi:hypothetical protein
MKKGVIIIFVLFSTVQLIAQQNSLEKLQFIIGNWSGVGTGFGNENSTITATYNFVMNKKYIKVTHESHFKPTEKKPKGEHHIDNGFISFDKIRNKIIYRQFNNEGFVNQYILNDTLSNKSTLIFETETIENFMPGGKARFTIKKISTTELETIFDVSFPNKEYSCFGTNKLIKN